MHLHSPEEISELIPKRDYWSTQDLIDKNIEKSANFESWISFYEGFGNNQFMIYNGSDWRLSLAPVEPLLKEFNKNTKKTGIMRLLAAWITLGAHHDLLTDKIDLNSYEVQHIVNAAILMLSNKSISSAQVLEIIKKIDLIVSMKNDLGSITMLIDALDRFMQNIPKIEEIYSALINALDSKDWYLISRTQVSNYKSLQSKYSGYDTSKLSELKLPQISN